MSNELLVTVEVKNVDLIAGNTEINDLEIGKVNYVEFNEGYCTLYQVERVDEKSVKFLALWELETKEETTIYTNEDESVSEGVVGQIVTLKEEELEQLSNYFDKHEEYFPEGELANFNIYDYLYVGIAGCVYNNDAPKYVSEAVVSING